MSPFRAEPDYAHMPADRRKQLTESSGAVSGTWSPSQPSVAGKLTEAERERLDPCGDPCDLCREELPVIVEEILAEREATLRAELAAAIEALPASLGHKGWDSVSVADVLRIVRTTEGTGGETA